MESCNIFGAVSPSVQFFHICLIVQLCLSLVTKGFIGLMQGLSVFPKGQELGNVLSPLPGCYLC
jgi:hypothetical protein